jgi:MSHA biogenesis protein MshN
MPGLDTSLELVPAARNHAVSKPVVDKPVPSVSAPVAQETLVATHGGDTSPAKVAPKAVPASSGAALKSVSASQQSENLYRQSVTLLQQGRVAEAQDALRKSLEANSRNLKARQTLVGLLVEGKHNDEAMALLQDGLKLAPEQSGFSMALARLQIESGDAKGGSETLDRGLQYAGDDADYHAFYAAVMQREERHDVAIAHYLTALKSNPAMPSWLVGIGISLQAQGQNADANEAYQRAKDTGQLTPQLLRFVDQRLQQVKSAR